MMISIIKITTATTTPAMRAISISSCDETSACPTVVVFCVVVGTTVKDNVHKNIRTHTNCSCHISFE